MQAPELACVTFTAKARLTCFVDHVTCLGGRDDVIMFLGSGGPPGLGAVGELPLSGATALRELLFLQEMGCVPLVVCAG